MKVLVNGLPAAVGADFSFDYVVENRFFLGREGYSLNISFPLKGCAENIAIFGNINRLDVLEDRVVFPCVFECPGFSLAGSLRVAKISESSVEGQFAAGRSEQTMVDPLEDVYINEMKLGTPSDTQINRYLTPPAEAWNAVNNWVALPWINDAYPLVPNNWAVWSDEKMAYEWDAETGSLSYQPYLIFLAKRICAVLGYSVDFSPWEKSPLRFLVVCNVLPASWEITEFARALPHWSVSEFFSQLELVLRCEFDFCHRSNSVSMRFADDVTAGLEPVCIKQPLAAHDAELSASDSVSSEFVAFKKLAFKKPPFKVWSYLACDNAVAKFADRIAQYDSLDGLIALNKLHEPSQDLRTIWGGINSPQSGRSRYSVNQLLYAKEENRYYAFRSMGVKELAKNSFRQEFALQPVNLFGVGYVDEEADTQELSVVPVTIQDTFIDGADRGFMMVLNPGDCDEGVVDPDNSPAYLYSSRPETYLSPINKAVEEGDPSNDLPAYYDLLFVGYWDGVIHDPDGAVYPAYDSIMISQSWQRYNIPGLDLRLHNSPKSFSSFLPKIDAARKLKVSWLSDSIPDPRARFIIRNKEYVCAKITASFSTRGMSEVLQGEFYPVAEA
jgi:hypothetical protein